MALPQGINFRNTAGYVTDGANEDHELGSSYPWTTAQGNSVGYTNLSDIGGTRDRNSSNDRRLAGMNFTNSSPTLNWRIDLPSAGDYVIRYAAGDASYSGNVAADLYDNASSLGNLTTGSTSGSQRFKDATNTELTNVTWPGSNSPTTKTFASTICIVKLNPSGATASRVAHFYIEASAAATTQPQLMMLGVGN